MLVRLPVLTIQMQWWTAGDALSDRENAQKQAREGWQAACRGLPPPRSLKKKIQEPLLLGPQFFHREVPKAMILPGLRVCVSKFINIWWLGENVGNVQFLNKWERAIQSFPCNCQCWLRVKQKAFAYVNYGSYWTALIKYMIAGA